MAYKRGDNVVVVAGKDAGRRATVVAGFEDLFPGLYGDGARIRFDDGGPTNHPTVEQSGAERDYGARMLEKV